MFEYEVFPVFNNNTFAYSDDGEARPMNELGRHNWELVAVTQDNNGLMYGWFKRKQPKGGVQSG